MEEGGLELVIKVLNMHINDSDVCKYGSRALVGLLKNNRKYSF